MPAVLGQKVLLYKSGTPDVLIGGQTDFSWDRSLELVEITSKDDAIKKFLPDVKDSSLEISALYIPTDQGLSALISAYDTGSTVDVEIYLDGSTHKTATCYVKSLAVRARRGEAAIVSVTLQPNTAWT